MRRAFDPRPGRCDPGVERAFVHAWMRGVAMRAAAQETPGARVEPRRAFLAGLFADLGAVALVAELAGHGVLGAEALRFAADQHAHASAWAAAEWRLPGECVVAAAQHHATTALYRADPLLLLLWSCEELVVQTAGADDPAPLPHGADATKLAGMSAGTRFDVERACRAASDRFAGVLGVSLPDGARGVA